jgi:tight adherence protein C
MPFLQLPSEAQPILLAASIVLLLGGLTLLAYSAHIANQAIGRRLGLVEARPEPRPDSLRAGDRAVRETYLLQGPAGGFSDRDQRELIRLVAALRIPVAHAATAILIVRLFSIAAMGLAAFFLGSQFQVLAGRSLLLLLTSIAFGIAGWFVPALIIGRLARSHAATAAEGLPDALELLVVCIEAGLALEDAIDRVARELQHSNPELAAELAQTSADLKILPNRDQALSRLADRVDAPSVRSFVITLSQTLRFGTPLAQAMRVVAAEMRNDSLLAMEERANRLPTLLTLPMMLFIMPTIFLVVGGPAALRVLDVFLR